MPPPSHFMPAIGSEWNIPCRAERKRGVLSSLRQGHIR